jgi:hypothetical protein
VKRRWLLKKAKVTNGPAPGKGGNQNPRSCCGKEMKKVEQ